MSQLPDLADAALAVSTALGAPIIEDIRQVFEPGRLVLAIYREHAPESYGSLPTLSGASFIDVTAVSGGALMDSTSSLTHTNREESIRLGCGLVVSDPGIRKEHYGSAAANQVCLDERAWAQDLFSEFKEALSLERKAARPAGWIFSVGQEGGLVCSVDSSNYMASIARRWFGGCKG